MNRMILYVTIRRSADGYEFVDMDGVSADPRFARQKAEESAKPIPQWATANPIIGVREAVVHADVL